MLANFFKSILRFLSRRPLLAGINIIGFALALAAVLLLAGYGISELQTDTFHTHLDDILQVAFKHENEFGIHSPAVLADEIIANVPGAESVCRIKPPWNESGLRSPGGEPLPARLVFADSTFFDVFSYDAVYGDLQAALRQPMSLVITEEQASRFFGSEYAIGKTLFLDNKHELTVSAIIRSPEKNASLVFDGLISMTSLDAIESSGLQPNWRWFNFNTFIKKSANVTAQDLQKNIRSLLPDFLPDELVLLPYSRFYFNKGLRTSFSAALQHGDLARVQTLLLTGTLILFIAVINFVNLFSSLTMERRRTFGMHKIVGARRTSILATILTEALLTGLFALGVAFIVAEFLQPAIRHTGLSFNMDFLFTPQFLSGAFVSVALVCLLSAMWPAMQLSAGSPIHALRNQTVSGLAINAVQKGLIIAQFAASIALIVFTIAVQKQISFSTGSVGFERENILTIALNNQLSGQKEVLRNELQNLAGVADITFSQFYPGKQFSHWGSTVIADGQESDAGFYIIRTDAHFPAFMDLKLKQGRFFDQNNASDLKKVIVNEAFVEEHGLTDPLNAKLVLPIRPFEKTEQAEIVGVVEDFHFQSVHERIAPFVMQYYPYASQCFAKLHPGSFEATEGAVKNITDICEALSPDFPVQISFLDTAVEQIYLQEIQFRSAFVFFSALTILVSCLGILGLAKLASEHRTREIGIRKVIGATTGQILLLLHGDFLKWIAIAFVLACPAAWYAIGAWLQNFAYRINLSWWMFVSAGALVLTVALLTISWQAIRAATVNPVNSLRYE